MLGYILLWLQTLGLLQEPYVGSQRDQTPTQYRMFPGTEDKGGFGDSAGHDSARECMLSQHGSLVPGRKPRRSSGKPADTPSGDKTANPSTPVNSQSKYHPGTKFLPTKVVLQAFLDEVDLHKCQCTKCDPKFLEQLKAEAKAQARAMCQKVSSARSLSVT